LCLEAAWRAGGGAEFFEKHVDKVGYTHLKTSENHKPQMVLGPNELSFDVYFAELEKHAKHYVAIELAINAGSLDEVFRNHIKSIEYLTEHY
jgi:sugar phosphate isomerase/epimerase